VIEADKAAKRIANFAADFVDDNSRQEFGKSIGHFGLYTPRVLTVQMLRVSG
jgi:hypothetical protein